MYFYLKEMFFKKFLVYKPNPSIIFIYHNIVSLISSCPPTFKKSIFLFYIMDMTIILTIQKKKKNLNRDQIIFQSIITTVLQLQRIKLHLDTMLSNYRNLIV